MATNVTTPIDNSVDFVIDKPTVTDPVIKAAAVPTNPATPDPVNPDPTATIPPTVPPADSTNTGTDNKMDIPLAEGDIVAINDIDYTIDKDGNAIDDKGSIFKTKAELDIHILAQSTTDTNTAVSVDDNLKKLIELTGTDVIIEDDVPTFTPEYIAKREAEIIKDTTVKAKDEAITEYLKSNPDLAAIASHKERFGTIENYGQVTDYSKFDITSMTEEDHANVIIEAEMQRGNTYDRAVRIANMSKSENTLASDATESLTYLKDKQNKEITAYNNAIAQERSAAIETMNRELGASFDDNGTTILNIPNSLYDNVVNKGSLGNIKIPANGIVINTENGRKQLNRSELFTYLAKPIQEIEGTLYSQAELDLIDKLKDRNYRSLYAIYAINGFDSLVKEKANENKVIVVKRNLATTPKSTAINNPAESGLGNGRHIVYE